MSSNAELIPLIKDLSSLPLCEGVPADQLRRMAEDLTRRSFVRGDVLANVGDTVDEFWLVGSGQLEALLLDLRGHESRLGVVGPGESIGEVAILENTPRLMRLVALSNGFLYTVPASRFRDWLEQCPALLRNLFRTLSLRFKKVVGIAPRALPARRLGVIATSPRGWTLAGRLLERLHKLGERLRVGVENLAPLKITGSVPSDILLHEVRSIDSSWFDEAPTEIDREVVIGFSLFEDHSDRSPWRRCDEVLWFIEPREVAAAVRQQRLWSIEGSGRSQVLRIVWLLHDDFPVAPHRSAIEGDKPEIKVPVESTGPNLTIHERQGIDRLIRALRGYSIGIALAGGGAKGMAHFGVLQALDQAGISFDAMSGTSAGAMVGILYAAGMNPREGIEHFVQDLTPSRWFKLLPKWPNVYLVTQFRRRAWERMLRRYLNDWHLEQLPIPFHSVTVDLVQVRPVVRERGDAVQAILESINLPIVSRPILRDGMVLVDGGVLNNLPADVLVDRQVDFVIGVDVSSRVRYEFAGNRPETSSAQMKPAGSLDTLFRIFEAQAHNIGNIRNRAVDFWITPDTSRIGLAEFHRTREVAELGESAAVSKLDELKAKLKELDQRILSDVTSRARAE